MSPHPPDAPVPDLESLRKRAKRLLRLARAADPDALRRLRARLPGMAVLDDRAVAVGARLADAQHVLALEHGFTAWAALRRDVESREPIQIQRERFLKAVVEGRLARARWLLRAHPSIPEDDILAACAALDESAVAALLARDPSLARATRPPDGWTPLLSVCASPFHAIDAAHGERSLRIARWLLDHGADANTFTHFDPENEHARIPALYWACVRDNPAVVRLLLERGAEPNDGESIYHAAEEDRRECLELLVAHGADVSAAHAFWGNTPLYFLSGYAEQDASFATALRGMRWLLEHGADPNVPSGHDRETPLHRVVGPGHGGTMATLLLEHGADASRPRGDGRTPFALAIRSGHVAVAEAMRSRGATAGDERPVDAFLGACMRGDEAGARALLAANPGLLDELTHDDLAMFAQAANGDRTESVRVLLACGFDPAWQAPGGATPLHHAAWRGLVDMTRLLIEHGAPVNVRDAQYGSSPLGWAAHGSNWRSADDDYRAVLEALVGAGAQYEPSVNRWGASAVQLASPGIARWLREHGFGGPARPDAAAG